MPTADASVPPLPIKPVHFGKNNTTAPVILDEPGMTGIEVDQTCIKDRTLCVGPGGPWGYSLPGRYGVEVNVTQLNATVWQEKDTLFEYGPVRVNILGTPFYVCNGRCVVEDNVQAHVNSTGYVMYVAGEDERYKHWEFDYNTTNETSPHYRIY